MADKILVDTERLNDWASQMSSVSGAISNARAMLSRVDTGEEWWSKVHIDRSMRLRDADSTLAFGNARTSVSAMMRTLNEYSDRLADLSKAVRSAADGFEDAENTIGSHIEGCGEGTDASEGAFSGAVGKAFGFKGDPTTWTPEMQKKYNEFMEKSESYVDKDGNTVYVSDEMMIVVAASGALSQVVEVSDKGLGGSATVRNYAEDGSYSEAKISNGVTKAGYKGDIKDWKKDKIFEEKEGYDEKGGSRIGKRESTLFEVGVDASEKIAAYSDSRSHEGKYTSGEASVDVGYAEANAGLHAGLYSTKINPDGTTSRVLEPGVDASIGASVGLAQAEASGRFGNDYVGVSGKVEAAIMEGDASARAQLGIVDGEVAARVSASAEFNVAEVGVEGGVDVLGVKGKVGAEASVGIGAHADIGYSDGTLVVDIGASIGVGGSVYFELDVKDAVNNVVDGAQDFCESVGDWFGDLGGWW